MARHSVHGRFPRTQAGRRMTTAVLSGRARRVCGAEPPTRCSVAARPSDIAGAVRLLTEQCDDSTLSGKYASRAHMCRKYVSQTNICGVTTSRASGSSDSPMEDSWASLIFFESCSESRRPRPSTRVGRQGKARPASRRDDIARFASTLEAVADGVGRADYEPTGLLGTRACSYCPDRASRGPYRRSSRECPIKGERTATP